MFVRISKAALVALSGLFLLLIGVDNLLDYGTNFAYVQHVMSMDTVPAQSAFQHRAVSSSSVHHLAYALIITVEILAGVICVAGAIRLFSARADLAVRFNAAKRMAMAGLLAGFGLWFFGFIGLGGEWFQMWQSPTWNGQQAAFRFAVCLGLMLVFVALRDDELG